MDNFNTKKKVRPMGIFTITLIAVIAAVILWFFAPTIFKVSSFEGEYQMLMTVNGRQLTATMENTPTSYALRRILERGSKTVSMRDYGSMEKVGMLWRRLPTADQNIVTQPGDIILYMGSAIVIYYDQNAWNFTKLGHIDNVSQDELKEILGNGNIEVKFELTN